MGVSNKYLFIRSNDRYIGTAGGPFTVKLPATYHNVSSLSLVSAEIPFSFGNVADNYTSGVVFTYNGVAYNLSIASGQYTISDIQTLLLATLQAAFPLAGVKAVDYSTVSECLSISFTGTYAFTAAATSAGLLGKLLGTDPSGAVTTAANNVLTFPNISQLFPYSSLLMCVDNLPANVLSTGTLHCFARIQVNAPPNGIIMVCAGTNVVNDITYASPIPSLDSLTISLKNNDGTPIDMRGADWTCTLMVTSSD